MGNSDATHFKLGSLFMHPVPTCCKRTRIFSYMADILTEVMHLYSTGGLICYWRSRGNE